ncbi:unnamed protein product [Chrysoparadoxa australica]
MLLPALASTRLLPACQATFAPLFSLSLFCAIPQKQALTVMSATKRKAEQKEVEEEEELTRAEKKAKKEEENSAKQAKKLKEAQAKKKYIRTTGPRKPVPTSSKCRPVKLLSWNVNSIRALLKNFPNALTSLVNAEDPDLLCIQETKIQEKHEKEFESALVSLGYTSCFSSSTKKLGYAGTAIFYKAGLEEGGQGKSKGQKKINSFFTSSKPTKSGAAPLPVLNITYGINKEEHDGEGRAITVEYEKFYVVALYTPNSGQGLKKLDYRLQEWDRDIRLYIKDLEQSKAVLVTGDLNCAFLDLDIYNYDAKHIKKQSGCTPQERKNFGDWLEEDEMVDTFRHFHPEARGAFTWWNQAGYARPPNNGLRLDYFLASKGFVMSKSESEGKDNGADPAGKDGALVIHDSFMLEDVEGSDHCPIGLVALIP